eukprot:2436575-Rhodomonas_salina.1
MLLSGQEHRLRGTAPPSYLLRCSYAISGSGLAGVQRYTVCGTRCAVLSGGARSPYGAMRGAVLSTRMARTGAALDGRDRGRAPGHVGLGRHRLPRVLPPTAIPLPLSPCALCGTYVAGGS